MAASYQAQEQQAALLLAAHKPLEAARCLEDAERLGADANQCAGQRWTCYMLAGAWEQAWRESDSLRRRNAPDPHRVWDGTPLAGRRVLVRSVHGLGDAVQMLRYLPVIARQAASLTLQVAPDLVALAQCAESGSEVVAWEHERPFDVQLEITELPYVFRSTPDTLPAPVPYLTLPAAALASASAIVAPSPRARIGLVWTSSAWDRSRSLPPNFLEPLLRARPDADYWCLQPSATSQEWDSLCTRNQVTPRRAGDDSLTTFAACVQAMDLVITIDSFAAHLAGALARPAWVLLKYHADWRWMVARTDTPWYPTLRLFRQPADGAWAPVIAAVATALAHWQPAR